jgi:hypothetical protein
MERKILQTLNWYLQPQTPYSWLRLYCQMAAKFIEEQVTQKRRLADMGDLHAASEIVYCQVNYPSFCFM